MITSTDPHIGIHAKTGIRIRSRYLPRRNRGRELSVNAFHVMSRFVKEVPFMDDVEKEGLRKLIWKMSAFLGVDVLTYCVMGNHFHVLIEVPERAKWLERFAGDAGEEKLLRHLGTFYSRAFMMGLRTELNQDRERKDERRAQQRLEEFRVRFCDLSVWMTEVKERFSKWLNKRRGRKGTLWMGRFRSKHIEGDNARLNVAAYIDLNPVRAEMVSDPKDYRWCGYAEALAGEERSQRGLCHVLRLRCWMTKGAEELSTKVRYRRVLFGQGQIRFDWRGQVTRAGFSAEQVAEVFCNSIERN